MKSETDLVEKKYQLCQMLFVNMGTNKHQPSNRITSIDPRGGASVMGANGIGKTTMLRLMPLFFGHLPSKLVAEGDGQEAMVRFILPTDASALVFEYQRGGDDELRLAVMRRRADDQNAHFYRIYRCGWDVNLFVDNGLFLNDEESQKRASARGIASTSTLTPSEYRAIILRTAGAFKNKKLRDYRRDHSFGPNSLEHLDRIVAAMLKKSVQFEDIVQVSVSMVHRSLGQDGEGGGRIAFKQSKNQIDAWLRNRQACLEAFKIEDKVSEQRENLEKFNTAENLLRALYWDVKALLGIRTTQLSDGRAAMMKLESDRESELEEEGRNESALVNRLNEALNAEAASRREYDDWVGKWEYLQKEDAAGWERKLIELPSMRSEEASLEARLEALSSQRAEVARKYQALADAAKLEKEVQAGALESKKGEPNQRYGEDQDRIGESLRASLEDVDAAHERVVQESARVLEPLIGQLGSWREKLGNPSVSQEAVDGLRQARHAESEMRDKADEARGAVEKAKRDCETLRERHHSAEDERRKARERIAQCEQSVQEAQALHAPAPGSLLHALRSHPDVQWKKSLARVIAPALLLKDDLDPQWVDDQATSLYGWDLQTERLPTPDWVNDEATRSRLEEARLQLGAAKQHLINMESGLAECAEALRRADASLPGIQAEYAILTAKLADCEKKTKKSDLLLEEERASAAGICKANVEKLEGQIKVLREEMRRATESHKAQRSRIEKEHGRERDAARASRDKALKDIESAILRLGEGLQLRLEALKNERDSCLREGGVDVDQMRKLEIEREGLVGRIKELGAKQQLVSSLQEFIQSNGKGKMDAAKLQKEKDEEAKKRCSDALKELREARERRRKQYAEQETAADKRIRELEADLHMLERLEMDFPGVPKFFASSVTAEESASELKGRVYAQLDSLREIRDAIEHLNLAIRSIFTAKDSHLKQLTTQRIDNVPPGGGYELALARVLCQCFDEIQKVIVYASNQELKTILANVAALSQEIRSFEEGIKELNDRLQKGLSGVKCFERIQDMSLHIVADFEELSFYKKLRKMSDVARENASSSGRDEWQLASQETANALGDFGQVLGSDGSIEVNTAKHITVSGSVRDNGMFKTFKRASELGHISSTGLTSLLMITLMTALINTMRGDDPVHVPWVTDEVGTLDNQNFQVLMKMLADNRIDFVTASPEITPFQRGLFRNVYEMLDGGRIRTRVAPPLNLGSTALLSAETEVAA